MISQVELNIRHNDLSARCGLGAFDETLGAYTLVTAPLSSTPSQGFITFIYRDGRKVNAVDGPTPWDALASAVDLVKLGDDVEIPF